MHESEVNASHCGMTRYVGDDKRVCIREPHSSDKRHWWKTVERECGCLRNPLGHARSEHPHLLDRVED